MKMPGLLVVSGIAVLTTVSALSAEAPSSGESTPDAETELAQSVEQLEKATKDLETLNINWRFWTGVIVFLCTGLVTVISAVSVFAKELWSTGLKITTASLSAIATVLALLPNTFHWDSEQKKYGTAFAELSAIEWDLRTHTKPTTELISRYEQVIRVIHEPGSIEIVSSTPAPSPTEKP